MKHKYSLTVLICLLGYAFINAQCPELSFVLSTDPEEIVFVFDNAGPDCATRPQTIMVDNSVYTLGNCDNFSSRYMLDSGDGVIDINNYTVTYGTDTCEYNNATLHGLDKNLISKTMRVFPNPLIEKDEINLKFMFNVSANIKVYSLTGKLVIKESMDNEMSKDINVAGLSNGVYLLKMTFDNHTLNKKFVITN